MKQNYDSRVLILGSSSIDAETYSYIAENINTDEIGNFNDMIITPANNPNATKEYVNKIKNDPNADEKIYERALKCVDQAEYIIVDLSAASTGMGLEVGYLLSQYANSKYITFIAKEGSKISPHIKGMYKHITGKEIEVGFYNTKEEIVDVIKHSDGYQKYYCNLIY